MNDGTSGQQVAEAPPTVGVATTTGGGTSPGRRWLGGVARSPAAQVGTLVALLGVPLLVALLALRDPRWLAMSDVAHVEMRVRDVGLAHPPLLGLGGRIEGLGEVGSHPGPLPFYVLAGPYRLLGSEGWALLAATSLLNLVAAGLAVWIGHRRGGRWFALAVTAAVLLLVRGYGIESMLQAWTPHLAMLWWVVFVLAAWSVVDDDLPMMPVAVFAGTFCVQAHVGYLGLVGGVGLVAAGALARRVLTGGTDEGVPWRRRWTVISAGLLAVLWLPPVVEQVTRAPGNVSVLIENFRRPDADQVPLGDALRSWTGHLNLDHLLAQNIDPGLDPAGPTVAGLLLLGAWLVSIPVAVRRRATSLVHLHAVVGVAFVMGLVSISRIYGPLFPYLALWAWGTTALMLLATSWTFLSTGEDTRSSRQVPRLRAPSAGAALAGSALLLTVAVTADARSPDMPDSRLVRSLDRLAQQTVDTLDGDPLRCGDDCQYLVTWSDPIHLGSQGYGMMVELDRRGFAVLAEGREATTVTEHRTVAQGDVDGTVHVAVTDPVIDPVIDTARRRPGARLVAYVDPYSADGRSRYEQEAADLADDLQAAGFQGLASQLHREGSTGGLLPVADDLPADLRDRVKRLNDVTRPSAALLLPFT